MNDACPTCGSAPVRSRLRGLCGYCLASGLLSDDDDGMRFAVPGHEVIGEIARGGMGIVYRARQLHPEREVALKMLLPQAASGSQRERFLLEARALASLDHPWLLPVYQSGEASGVPFFTMKLARSGSLAARRADYRGQWRRVAELMAGLAEAVQFAHGHGVLHRDLKPGNVLFDDDAAEGVERAYVADFGLAKVVHAESDLTGSVAMLGTPHYVAPEVAERGAPAATTASDIYSLGVILYELLAQRRPFEAASVPALLREIVEKPPPAVQGCPRDLQVIAHKALAKNPAARYDTARALAADLRRWLAGQPIRARAASAPERLWAWTRRQPALAAMILLLITCMAAGAVLLIGKNRALSRGLADEQLARATALQQSGDIRSRDAALDLLRAAVRGGANLEAAREQAITLLATPSWRELRRVPWRAGASVAVAPDFSLFAELHDGTLRVRPMESGGVEQEISCPDPPGSVEAVFNAPQRIAVRFGGGIVRLYDVGKKMWTHEWHGLQAIKFTRDGRRIARTSAGSRDVTIEDTGGPAPAMTITSIYEAPRLMAFSRDGSRLALANAKNGEVEIADIPSQKIIAKLQHPWRRELALKAAWHPDGRALAIGTDVPDLFVWQIDGASSWHHRLRGHHMEITSVTWHPEGEWIATASFDQTVRVWGASSGRELLRLPLDSSVAGFSEDGGTLLCSDVRKHEFVLSRFDVPDVMHQVQLSHESPDVSRQRGPFGLALTPDGKSAVVAGNGTWLLDTDAKLTAIRVATPYGHEVCFAGPETLYVVRPGGIFRSTLSIDSGGNRMMTVPELFREMPGAIRMSWSASTRSFAVTTRQNVWLVGADDPSRPPREFTTGGVPVNPVALSPDGRWIVAGTDGEQSGDAPPMIFDTTVAGTSACATLPVTGLVYPVFSPDNQRLYTMSPQGLAAWQAGTWQRLWAHPPSGDQLRLGRIALSGDGRILAASVFPQGIRLHDATTGQPLATLRHPDRRGIAWIALDAGSTRLAASGSSHVIQFWDLVRLRERLDSMGMAWPEPN